VGSGKGRSEAFVGRRQRWTDTCRRKRLERTHWQDNQCTGTVPAPTKGIGPRGQKTEENVSSRQAEPDGSSEAHLNPTHGVADRQDFYRLGCLRVRRAASRAFALAKFVEGPSPGAADLGRIDERNPGQGLPFFGTELDACMQDF
jgi:hypothetical protein